MPSSPPPPRGLLPIEARSNTQRDDETSPLTVAGVLDRIVVVRHVPCGPAPTLPVSYCVAVRVLPQRPIVSVAGRAQTVVPAPQQLKSMWHKAHDERADVLESDW